MRTPNKHIVAAHASCDLFLFVAVWSTVPEKRFDDLFRFRVFARCLVCSVASCGPCVGIFGQAELDVLRRPIDAIWFLTDPLRHHLCNYWVVPSHPVP